MSNKDPISVKQWFIFMIKFLIPVYGIYHLLKFTFSKRENRTFTSCVRTAWIFGFIFIIVCSIFWFITRVDVDNEVPKYNSENSSSASKLNENKTNADLNSSVSGDATSESFVKVNETKANLGDIKNYGKKSIFTFESKGKFNEVEIQNSDSFQCYQYESEDKNYTIVTSLYATESVSDVYTKLTESIKSQVGEIEINEEETTFFGKNNVPCKYCQFVFDNGFCIDVIVFTGKDGRTRYLGISAANQYAFDAIGVKYSFD